MAKACRVGSEILKLYTRKSIERYLDGNLLRRVYWQDEPLDTESLSRLTGINITQAETQFDLNAEVVRRRLTTTSTKSPKKDLLNSTKRVITLKRGASDNEIQNGNGSRAGKLIQDIFVSCSTDRERSYTLTINLELENPFKVIEFKFNWNPEKEKDHEDKKVEEDLREKSEGVFRIYLPQSTFIVDLNQRIRYDECLDVKFVQLASNINYSVECIDCNEKQKDYLDRILNKKMSQFDAELDSILSEKLLLGLQVLLNQKRLDLDLFLI